MQTHRTMTIISGNTHSAMSEARLESLLEELADIHWDVFILTETWREESHEQIRLHPKHMFYGSSERRRSCGVGFLVREGFAKVKFTPMSSRIASLESGDGTDRVNIFGVYFPDSSYPDVEVEVVFEQLDIVFLRLGDDIENV